MDQVSLLEQVPVVQIPASNVEGVDHMAAERRDPTGSHHGSGRRDGTDNRESLRLGLKGGPVTAVPRPDRIATGLISHEVCISF